MATALDIEISMLWLGSGCAEPRLHFSRLEGARRMNPRLVRLFIAAATCGCGNNSISGAGGPEGLESIAFASCDAGGVSQITLSMPDGSHQRMVTNTSSPSWFPAWSPDGARLMFTREVADAGGGRVPQLWVMNADGTRARALVTSGISMAGSWSSDGQRIAYHHRPSLQEGGKIWVARDDGSQARQLTKVTASNVDENVPRLSPDRTQITFTSNLRGRYEIWVADVVSGAAVRLTEAYFDSVLTADIEQKVPAWSPDGQLIAYWSGVEANDPRPGLPRDVRVMNADGSGQKRLVEGDDPNWSPSGEYILHSTLSVGPPALGIVRPDGRDARILFTINACRPLQSSWFEGP